MGKLDALMKLKGRRALVTGATGSLGRVISNTLAELGADLLILDYKHDPLVELASEITSEWGVKVSTLCCNLELKNSRDEIIANLLKEGGVNILINNAAFVGTSGLKGWSVPFVDQSIETWRIAIEVNLTAIFHLCQGLMPLLNANNNGTIINIGSIYGEFGPDWGLYAGTSLSNPAAYSVSKGGLLQLTRWLSTTMAPSIRVNAISPGGIARKQDRKFVARYEKRTPLGRMATEDDFRGAIAFLASDMSAYVTGQNLAVDGGWGVW